MLFRSDYKHLQLRVVANGGGLIMTRFNGDSASNYSAHRLYGNGFNAISQAFTATTQINSGFGTTTTNVFAVSVIDILDFSSTSKNKTIRYLNGDDGAVALGSGAWYDTSAITQILSFPNSGSYAVGSRFSLYGIRGE